MKFDDKSKEYVATTVDDVVAAVRQVFAKSAEEEPELEDVVTAVQNQFGSMLKIRVVQSFVTKDGFEYVTGGAYECVMLDDGIQYEKDGGGCLYCWSEIASIVP